MRPVKFTANNQISLLHNGAEFFPALIAAADAARKEIYLETYIFSADETADAVRDALVRAAQRGVTVNVVIDWLGTGPHECKLLQNYFTAHRVNCRVFNPWFKRGIARTHRKIFVADWEEAIVGGLNIIDDLRDDDDAALRLPAPRWDMAARIHGPLVAEIDYEAVVQWRRIGPLQLKTRWDMFRSPRELGADVHHPMLAGLVVRDNLRNRRTIQRAYLKALGGARHKALLANPYFAPGRRLRTALARAAARGVDVTLLLGVGQFRIQDLVAQSFYPTLLKHGVKIVEYRKTALHGKVAVVDHDWATVGSCNYDGLSLFVNQEANIVVKDVGFCDDLRAQIEAAVAEGVVIRPQDYLNIPWPRRFWYGAAYLLYKSVLRLISVGKYEE